MNSCSSTGLQRFLIAALIALPLGCSSRTQRDVRTHVDGVQMSHFCPPIAAGSSGEFITLSGDDSPVLVWTAEGKVVESLRLTPYIGDRALGSVRLEFFQPDQLSVLVETLETDGSLPDTRFDWFFVTREGVRACVGPSQLDDEQRSLLGGFGGEVFLRNDSEGTYLRSSCDGGTSTEVCRFGGALSFGQGVVCVTGQESWLPGSTVRFRRLGPHDMSWPSIEGIARTDGGLLLWTSFDGRFEWERNIDESGDIASLYGTRKGAIAVLRNGDGYRVVLWPRDEKAQLLFHSPTGPLPTVAVSGDHWFAYLPTGPAAKSCAGTYGGF